VISGVRGAALAACAALALGTGAIPTAWSEAPPVPGASARVRLSNVFGTRPLLLGHASIAVAAGSGTAEAAPGTVRELTFGGRASVPIPADADLLVTTCTPTPSGARLDDDVLTATGVRTVIVPQDPLVMRAEYDSGDHLHPGDAGFRAMADAVDLALLR
jgi:hypothetical protein